MIDVQHRNECVILIIFNLSLLRISLIVFAMTVSKINQNSVFAS